jgi:protocatechuate 3,4-dioxygenase beta subunit
MLALPFVWRSARAQAAMPRRATPAQTEGPFYPVRMPADADADLLRNGALRYTRGQPVWLDGTVQDLAGRPVRGAQVEIWQCDEQGHYAHPGDGDRQDPAFQGFGRVTVAADGSYRFRTIRPAPYTGRTPHIHVKVFAPSGRRLTTQMYIAGDPGNERDSLFRGIPPRLREQVLLKLEPANGVEPGALAGSLDIVLG